MKNRIYTYFFYEFIRYFTVVIFALTAILLTIQAVNFLDLVTEDGHAFRIYLTYSALLAPKLITKLIPFAFLIASLLTILKLEKDNELIILWTSGLNKIHIVNLMFRISVFVVIVQLLLSTIITPKTLNISRTILKNSELQFVSSLLKERKFNDTVKGLTFFVNKKNPNGVYENIFIRDESKFLTQVSAGSSTIIAKAGYVSEDEKSLVLLNGNIQKINAEGTASIIKFEKTELNLSGLSTKSISEPKIQETSTYNIVMCMQNKNKNMRNCERHREYSKDNIIEINKRFGMPLFIPLIALIMCFLLSSRRDKKNYYSKKYIYSFISVIILISSEITVRYSGISLGHTFIYYSIPVALLPIIYIYLIWEFKYENLRY